ncbi:MAG: GIY-YIG nuclease family protein [Erythrobacter sp.]|nr:GIY-YIG nuclease family protein [Erythrobacter sp.]
MMLAEGTQIIEEGSDQRQIWLRAFYGFDPEGAGYLGFTRAADQADILSRMRAGDLVLIYGAVETLTEQNLRAQALGFLQVTDEPCDDKARMSEASYQWKVEHGFQERWTHGIRVDRAWRIRNRVHIKTIAPEAFDNVNRFERTTRAIKLSDSEVRRAMSHPVEEVQVYGEPTIPEEVIKAPLASIWSPSKGPRPTFGERKSNHVDGENCVYLMELEGLTDRLLAGNSTHSIFKVGRSNAPKRREDELNSGFPPSALKRWRLIRSEKFTDADTAHDVEEELKTELDVEFRSEGGEFFSGRKREIESLFSRVCTQRMHAILGAEGKAFGTK